MKNKGRVGLFQISQKETFSCTLSKKVFSFRFGLGKKRIYLEIQVKGEFTDLF